MVTVSCECPSCGKVSEVTCDPEGLRKWQNGALVQNALPDLSAADREKLITGMCEECWESLFAEI